MTSPKDDLMAQLLTGGYMYYTIVTEIYVKSNTEERVICMIEWCTDYGGFTFLLMFR